MRAAARPPPTARRKSRSTRNRAGDFNADCLQSPLFRFAVGAAIKRLGSEHSHNGRAHVEWPTKFGSDVLAQAETAGIRTNVAKQTASPVSVTLGSPQRTGSLLRAGVRRRSGESFRANPNLARTWSSDCSLHLSF